MIQKILILSFFNLVFLSFAHSQTSGHLKFGLLHFEILDTANSSETFKNTMIDEFQNQFTYDVYFNNGSMLEVRTIDSSKILKTLFDKNSPGIVSFYLTTPEGNYYVIDSSLCAVDDLQSIEAEKKALKEIIIFGDPLKDKKTIFGFESIKVTILNPEDKKSEYLTSYMSPDIPYFTISSKVLTELFPGHPLESTMTTGFFKVQWGVTSFNPIVNSKEIFLIDTDGYKKITYIELKALGF